MGNKMIHGLIRIAIVVNMISLIFASADINDHSTSIDLGAYTVRKTQPLEGTIYDPCNKGDPIIWLFDPPCNVRLFIDKLWVQRFEGYADRKVIIHLMVSGTHKTNVLLTVKNMEAHVNSGELSLDQLTIIVGYVQEYLKITLGLSTELCKFLKGIY